MCRAGLSGKMYQGLSDVFSLALPCVTSRIWKCHCDERPFPCIVSAVTCESPGLQFQLHGFLFQFVVAVVVLLSRGPASVKARAVPVPPRKISCVRRLAQEGFLLRL